jgi:hypothetical protein
VFQSIGAITDLAREPADRFICSFKSLVCGAVVMSRNILSNALLVYSTAAFLCPLASKSERVLQAFSERRIRLLSAARRHSYTSVHCILITANAAQKLAAKTLKLDNDIEICFKLRPFNLVPLQATCDVYLVLPGDLSSLRMGQLQCCSVDFEIRLPCILDESVHPLQFSMYSVSSSG